MAIINTVQSLKPSINFYATQGQLGMGLTLIRVTTIPRTAISYVMKVIRQKMVANNILPLPLNNQERNTLNVGSIAYIPCMWLKLISITNATLKSDLIKTLDTRSATL